MEIDSMPTKGHSVMNMPLITSLIGFFVKIIGIVGLTKHSTINGMTIKIRILIIVNSFIRASDN
jgi:hypothetical protein